MQSRITVKFQGDASDVKRQIAELTNKGYHTNVVFKGDTSSVKRDANGLESRVLTSRVEFKGNADSIKKMQNDLEGSKTKFTVMPTLSGSAMSGMKGVIAETVTGALRQVGANMVDIIGSAFKAAIGTAGDVAKFSMEKSIERQNLLLAGSVAYKGNMEASGKAIQASIDYANRTPFKTQAVGSADVAYKLATKQERSQSQREEIGNVAALVMTAGRESADEAYKNISNIYTRIQTEGRVTNEALSRLSERGVDIYGALGKQLGMTNAEVRELASDSQLTADQFQKAFTKLAGPGSALDGLAKGLGETTGGKLSTFQDSFETAGVALGNAFAPAINSVLDLGTTIVNEIANSSAFNDIALQAQQFTDEIKNNPALVKEITEAAVNLARSGLQLCVDGAELMVNIIKDPETPGKIQAMADGFAAVAKVIQTIAEGLVNSIKLIQDLAAAAADISMKVTGDGPQLDGVSQDTSLAWDGQGSASIAGVKMPTNVAAFIEMFRVGEGTVGDSGYNTQFTGTKFSGFADHPREIKSSGDLHSDAAGMPQFLSTTWDGVKGQIGAKDFSPANQVKGAIQLIKNRGVYDDLLAGNLDKVLEELSHEWASLPTSTQASAGRYGQPAKTGPEAKRIFEEKLAMFNSASPVKAQPPSTSSTEVRSIIPKLQTSGTSDDTPSPTTSNVSRKPKTGKTKMEGSITGRLDGSGQNGADMDVGPNNEMYSYHNGVVSELGTANNNGNYVVIKYIDDLNNKLEATYSHIAASVKVGDQVIGGQVLGKFDGSGRTFGAHNSIDINTPGTNGALQRDAEGAAARRGADLLVKGIVQGQGIEGGSVSQKAIFSSLESDATKAQREKDKKEREEKKRKQEIERKRQEALKVASAEDKARYLVEDAELNKTRARRDARTSGKGSEPTQEVNKLSDRFEDAQIKTKRGIKALEADSKERPTYKKANDLEIKALKEALESEKITHETALKAMQEKLENTAKEESLRLEVSIKTEQSRNRQISSERALANLTSQVEKDKAILNMEYEKLKESYRVENEAIELQITQLQALIDSYTKAGMNVDALNKQKEQYLALQKAKETTHGNEIGIHLDTKERADKEREKTGKEYLRQFKASPGDAKSQYIGVTQGQDAQNAYDRKAGRAQIEEQYLAKSNEAQQQHKDGNISAEQLSGVNKELENLKNADLSALNRQFKTLGETIAESVSKELGDAFISILDGSKSVEEAVTGMLKNLAKQFLQMAVNKMMTSLFGSMLGGSGGITIGSGGISNYAAGKGKGSYSPDIETAIRNERLQSGGRQPYLAVLNTDEIVLSASQSKELLTTGTVSNMAMGNMPKINNVTGGSNISLTVNNTGSGEMSPEQLKTLSSSITQLVDSRIGNATRPGGLLR